MFGFKNLGLKNVDIYFELQGSKVKGWSSTNNNNIFKNLRKCYAMLKYTVGKPV